MRNVWFYVAGTFLFGIGFAWSGILVVFVAYSFGDHWPRQQTEGRGTWHLALVWPADGSMFKRKPCSAGPNTVVLTSK